MSSTLGIPKRFKKWLKRQPFFEETNRVIKARIMEAEAAASVRKHNAEAARRTGGSSGSTDFGERLKHRLGDRPRRLGWPKQKGELHVFLTYGMYNWEAALPAALAPFGRLSTFEWTSHGFNKLGDEWMKQRDAMNAAMLAAFEAANRECPVDIVVGYVSGLHVAPDILSKMARHGAVIANFCFDDKISFPGPIRGGRYLSNAAIAHAVDLNLTNDPEGQAKYSVYGGLAMFHPEAADPDRFAPTQVPLKYPVSFIGHRFGWRPKFIDKLRKRGVEVTCFGQGWPNGAVNDEDMPEIYSASRINLGFGGIGHSQKLMCLKGRDFEVPMSGGLYLTQHNPELSMVYDLGREILVYRDVDDCAQIIRDILADEPKAAAIRAAGRARALRDHTYLERWSHVFRVLGAMV